MASVIERPIAATARPARRPRLADRWHGAWSFIARALPSPSAKFRITVGLVGILTSLILVADMIGLIPDRTAAVRDGRVAIAEAVAVNATAFITQSDLRRMEANLALTVERNADLLSAAIRRLDGKAVAIIGDHEGHWQALADAYSTDTQLQVPIWAGDNQWGELELRFQPLRVPGLAGVLANPLIQIGAFLSSLCFFIFYFYLGKMLTHLDPSQAIPGRVRSTLDTIVEGLLVLDRRERVVLANQAFAALVGKSADELMGYRAADFRWTTTGGEPLAQSDTPWGLALMSGESQRNTLLRLQIDAATRRTFMVNSSPILGSGGKAHGVLVSLDDVTELEQKEIELRQSKEAADAANRSKSEFLANMSHEIRTPMNAILGYTEVLKRGYRSNAADTAKHLNTIHTSGKYLLELINDILDLSKVEAGNIDVEHIPCAPHSLIRETVKVLGVKAGEKGVSLSFEPQGELPAAILSDPVRLRQIITNLVGNAIKFTEQGAVRVVARIEHREARPQMAIDVIDTGIGMTAPQAESVFSPFVQADSSITRRFGGTGLGLSISKRFAEALGGDISVRSEPGKGSVFTLRVDTGPLDEVEWLSPEALLVEEEAAAETAQVQWEFPPARVLVVDDGDENRALVQLVLEEAGLSVDTAENGRIGCDRALAQHYDIILMDVSMPEMDGYAATSLLRDRGVGQPIVALTAHAMGDVEQRCRDAGYSDYMTKPIDIDALLALVAAKLGGRPRAAVPPERPATEPAPAATAPAATDALPDRLVSRLLADGDPRMRPIVERFVARLAEQLEAMDQALAAGDLEALAGLAHWLKGAGGTVGYDAFTEPAQALERLAKEHRGGDMLRPALDRLRALAGRIRMTDD